MKNNPMVWPNKVNLFGVGVSHTTYNEAVDIIIRAASLRQPAVVSSRADSPRLDATTWPGMVLSLGERTATTMAPVPGDQFAIRRKPRRRVGGECVCPT